MDDLAVQKRILERESAAGADHRDRLAEIATKSTDIESRLATLGTRFEKERELVTVIRDLRTQLEGVVTSQNGKGSIGAPEIPGVAAEAASPALAATGTAVETSSATATAVEETAKPVDPAELRSKLAQAEAELSALQGETPMIRVAVDAQIVGEVISAGPGSRSAR